MTRDEAIDFSKHHAKKSDTVIVLPDGQVYLGFVGAAEILKAYPDAILIKGDEALKPAKEIAKNKKDSD